MKKYIKPIPLFFLISAVLALLAAFRYDSGSTPASTSATGSTISSMKEEDMPANEIPLPDGITIHEFFYDPTKNTICFISRTGNTFQLFLLGIDNIWKPSTKWNVSAKDDLVHFVYSTDGKLYACMKTTQDKLMTQRLVRLKKDGTLSKIQLKALEKVPKISGRASHNITDIRFSGTALAITYQNTAVKFYNIEEGQALGASSIRGEAHHNIFYKYHYISSANVKNSSSLLLKDYDIRTGEQDHIIYLNDTDKHNREFWLDNYREKMWLLSVDGLFTGKYTDSRFQKVLTWEETALPEVCSVQKLLASRDNILYVAYLDDNDITHLIHIDVSLPPVHSETVLKNELDFSPPV